MSKLILILTSLFSSIGGFFVKVWDISSNKIKDIWVRLKEKLDRDPEIDDQVRRASNPKKLVLVRRFMALLVSGTTFYTLYETGVLQSLFPRLLWGSPVYLWISAIFFSIQVPIILVKGYFDLTQSKEKLPIVSKQFKKISSLVGATEIGQIPFLKFPTPHAVQSFSYQSFQRLPKISKLIEKWNSQDLMKFLQNYTIQIEPDINNKGLHRLLEKIHDKPINTILEEIAENSNINSVDRLTDGFKALNKMKGGK